VVATVTVGNNPEGVAVTPDGKHAYVTNFGSNNVTVVRTATNTVVATIPVGAEPLAVGIIPPPGVPFLAFSARLAITFGAAPNQDSFNLHSPITLSSTAPGLDWSFFFVSLKAQIYPTGLAIRVPREATGASLTETTTPVPVTLTIGDDCGTTSVTALIIP